MRRRARKGYILMEQIKSLISPALCQAIDEMGYVEATPIQEAAIPPMLQGRDIVGQAQTGTGKTAAFGIPLAQGLDPENRAVQALVLCPTRELAIQTAGELVKLTKHLPGVSVLPVYGGAPIDRQLRGLRAGCQVVVGTPGRVMDHMNRGTLTFESLHLCVLDEADEMLDMGFRDDIETILSATPETRQTALFSATMPAPIRALAQKYLKDPVSVSITPKEMTVEKIDQCYISVRSFHKTELLSRLLILEDIKLALVFVNTKAGVEGVVTELQHRGFSAAGLHGDMRQIERDAIMARFRNGLINVLVATDVAARGIDVDDIEAVFNYDMPGDVEYYVHRIGRTGRAGKDGKAFTFVVGRETSRMWDFRRLTGAKILCRPAPDAAEVQKVLSTRVMAEVVKQAVEGEEADPAIDELARSLIANVDTRRAVGYMLARLIAQRGAKIDASIDLNPPAPVRPARSAVPPASPRRVGPYGRPANPDSPRARTLPANPRYERGRTRTLPADPRQQVRSHGARPLTAEGRFQPRTLPAEPREGRFRARTLPVQPREERFQPRTLPVQPREERQKRHPRSNWRRPEDV